MPHQTFKYICFFAFLIIEIGCSSKQNKSQDTYSWSTLTIASEGNLVVIINNQDDTSSVKHYDRGSIFTGRHKLKVDSLKTYFSMVEKDTLYNIIKDIISNPIKPKHSCTDFVGDLKLVVDYGNFKNPGSFRQSIEYSGICNWAILSPNLGQLNKILKRKIKWWTK